VVWLPIVAPIPPINDADNIMAISLFFIGTTPFYFFEQ
jgi:hypothetical protein